MAVSISGEGVISGSSSYSFDSGVSIAGTTTIEDVTSVDSVGIITAQSGIRVTGGELHVTNGTRLIGVSTFHNVGDARVTGITTFQNTVRFDDDVELRLGNSDDLKIEHNGSNSTIKHSGGGNFFIQTLGSGEDLYLEAADNILIRPQGGENGIRVVGNSAVELYWQNSMKLETKSDGIDVTGEVQCDSLDVDGYVDIAGGLVMTGIATIGNITVVGDPGGNNNIAFGRRSFEDISLGNHNAAFGRMALQEIVNGDYNTAVGNHALRDLTDGDNNTGVGRYALLNVENSNGNTAIGVMALSGNVSGSNNAAIGYKAGTNIEGSNNTILGAYEGVDSDSALSDTVIISAGTSERLRVDSSGRIGIGITNPTRKLEVVGRISKTLYEPGEIIEQISSFCDGSSHTVKSGTYTMANVTAEQAGSTSDATASGSSINYTPPLGTKRIHYQYWFKWEALENSGISHFFIQVDGNDVVISRRTKASNYSRYSSSYYHHAEEWYCMSCVLECDASSTDTSEGQYAGWAANQETKTIRVRFREYNGSYEISLHGNQYWDGSSATGTNQKPIKPYLIVTAIA